MIIYNSIQYILFVFIGLAVFYILLFAVAGLFYKQKPLKISDKLRKIAVLIPGYSEDEVIIEVAKAALQQEYAMSLFDVVVIADSFQEETLIKLKSLPIKIIEVSFDKSTKSKALNKGMSELSDDYDIAVVLDADNVMAPDFLSKINAAFDEGYIAVQGHRTAKNINNSWAILDAISEEINNHIFRKGHRSLGLSSAIIGSGMAFKYDFFKEMMLTVTAVGGFDKEIELKMLKEGNKIAYLDDAFVFDEKIQNPNAFSNQRRRWLSAQLHYFQSDFLKAVKALILNGNVDYFDKAIQFIQPPRILLLGAVIIFGFGFFLGNYFLKVDHNLSFGWLTLIVGCFIAMIISVPAKFFNYNTLKALAGLPKGMLLMLLSLLKIKGANKKFIHTKHTVGSL
jgi:cellulose synthase/poly-beta-1,6-N-acetylglucosamine synthase-like glycosyltransferase